MGVKTPEKGVFGHFWITVGTEHGVLEPLKISQIKAWHFPFRPTKCTLQLYTKYSSLNWILECDHSKIKNARGSSRMLGALHAFISYLLFLLCWILRCSSRSDSRRFFKFSCDFRVFLDEKVSLHFWFFQNKI